MMGEVSNLYPEKLVMTIFHGVLSQLLKLGDLRTL